MPRPPGATQDEIRRHNVSTLLRHVHEQGALSRSELAHVMGLNRSTIKALVTELADAGLVTESIPESQSRAGRPSHVVVARTDSVYVLAANVRVDGVTVAAVGLGGEVLVRREYAQDGIDSRPGVVVGRLSKELLALRRALPAGARVVGVGVSLPGIVRRTDGKVELAPNLGWQDFPFGVELGNRLDLGVPLQVGNDGDVGALAEHLRGAGRGVDDMVFLAGGIGVGGGLVVAGVNVQGSGGFAGEVGHLVINPEGRKCRCGSVGCLETEAGEEALLLAAGVDPTGGREAYDEVIARARAGDAEAVAAVNHVGVWLGRGLASLCNVLNPSLVILGGSLLTLYEVARDAITIELDRHALRAARRSVRIEEAWLGFDAQLIGAAELAFEGLLHDPVDAWWQTGSRGAAGARVGA